MRYATVFLSLPLALELSATPAMVGLHTASPNVIVVVLEDSASVREDSPNPLPPPSLPSGWTVDGRPPDRVCRYTVPYDQLRRDDAANSFPVTVRHKIYLVLPQSLQEGRTYAVATPYGNGDLVFSSVAAFCESVKVNQEGYSGVATSRFANLGVFMGDGGSMTFGSPLTYDVVEEGAGRTVLTGQARYMGDDTAKTGVASGEHVYRLSLNDAPSGGPYFVSVRGFGRSRSFGIGDDYTRKIAYTVTRGLYHQRCGIALKQPFTAFTRGVCHTRIYDVRADVDHHPMPIPIPFGTPHLDHVIIGGYHDAGDFDRRPMHTVIPLLMLNYFEAFPMHFVDNQYDIPESGNTIPDFLDEALWGLKLWENLQIVETSDPLVGAVRPGTGDAHAKFGSYTAATDPYDYATYAVADSAGSRSTGGSLGSDVTSLCAGMFAQASRLLRPYDVSRADRLLNRAQAAWRYLKKRFPELNNPADPAVRRSRYMYAALQMYLATGDSDCHAIFRNAADFIVLQGGRWPEQYLPGNSAAACKTAHFISYLPQRPRAGMDQAFADLLKSKLISTADAGTYMGPPPEGKPYPQGVTKFMGWGTATAQGMYADVYAFASLFATGSRKQVFINAVAQYSDYSLGLNPMGMSYYTGLGTDRPQSPCHADSYFTRQRLGDHASDATSLGNVPGILIYGPTEGRSRAGHQLVVSNQLYPVFEDLPAERRWGDGWLLINCNEFTTWETMVWNVVMFGFLYHAGGTSPPEDKTVPRAPRRLRQGR